MSVESAVAYIKRMRSDDAFRRTFNDCEDEEANWTAAKAFGYDFTMSEFKQAQDVIYKDFGITPL